MSLTKNDLQAIKKLFEEPLGKLEERLVSKIDDLTLNVGQFSLETTKRIDDLDAKLSEKIDNLADKLDVTTETSDTNRVEIAKVKRKLGLT